jgi:hypothetical protein
MSRAHLYGTLFYSNYATRALALYRSLEAQFVSDFTLVMLCMDDDAIRIMEQLKLPRAELVPVCDVEWSFADLSAVKSARSIAEYSWTSTPFFLRYLLRRARTGETIVYLDTDMMFYSDPQPIFDECANADIAIHEHRCAPRHQHHERTSGVFNVGWVGVRNSDQGNRCMERWARQCIELCVYDPERGLCGDQRYLEEWPALYDRLAIIQHKGAGLGPWNLEQYELTESMAGPLADSEPVIFYHFSALRILSSNLFGHLLMIPALGYRFTPIQRRLIYRPYAERLRDAYRQVRSTAAGAALVERRPTLPELRATRRGILVF